MSFSSLYRQYPQLSLCSLLIVVLGALGSFLYLSHSHQAERSQINIYGNLLAKTAARQAVDPTLTQDLVSLQAILQDVSQNPAVVGVTIHTVENKLLVQNGHRANQSVKGRRFHYTAPISVHNNIAGYLQVTLETPHYSSIDKKFLAVWAIAVGFSLLIIWWTIQKQWWVNLKDRLPSARRMVQQVVHTLPTIPDVPIDQEPEEPQQQPEDVAVRLELTAANLTRLYQQLNSEGFTKLLSRYDGFVNDALRLHHGLRHELKEQTLAIDFIGTDLTECSFKALCVADLVMYLCQQAPSPRLQLGAVISQITPPQKCPETPLVTSFIAQQQPKLYPETNYILVSQSLIKQGLGERVIYQSSTGHIDEIKMPYRDLLDRQQQQLSKS